MNYQLNYNSFSDKPSILGVLAQYGIEVKRKGQRYWASCPFHNEKTPSLCIYPEQQKFYCFGCGRAGDSWDLLAHLSGKPLREVLRDYNIGLPEPALMQKLRERAEILRKFEAECLSCWKRLTFLLRETYQAERELQEPTDENLEKLADIFYLREIVESLLNKMESAEVQTRLKAIAEAKGRGLYDELLRGI